MKNQQNLKTVRTLIAGGLVASTLITGAAPADADVSQQNIQSLNPRQQKYNRCPKDADCYILSTRIISGQVADPSELSGDENYILPIWSIIDGMGVDVHPLATDSDDFFRVNIAKKTIGNMGRKFSQRRTGRTINLRNEHPAAYKLHTNKDFVVPMAGNRWTTDGLIFSVNMMEHDNSKRSDIDREYLKSARRVQAGLLRNAQSVRVGMRSPTYYSDAAKATYKFTKEAAPMAASAYAAYQTGGAAAAAGSVDISSLPGLFQGLWSGLKRLDKDDVGHQKTVYIPFRSLRNGVEKQKKICGKTDPSAANTGKFCITIGVKLDLYSRKSADSAFDKRANSGTGGGNTGTNTSQNTKYKLAGTWKANDGGIYTITQSGNRIYWKGKGGNFINKFSGVISGRTITGKWHDTAASQTQNRGTLKLRINSSNKLTRIGRTGAFTGSVWKRVTSNTGSTGSTSRLKEDCLAFNPRALSIRNRGGSGGWTITQGRRLLFSFGNKKADAQEALKLMKGYGFNQSCFVGRPDPSMRYLKKGSTVPKFANSAIKPKDCININNRNLSLRKNGANWALTDGRSIPLSSHSKAEMVQAKTIIEKHGLSKQCFVGRPNPPFAFWLR
ncbi:hypothetical protein [Synechococcus sp. RS9916]|uniref:hypothetical protein n=1 Tax=Synechococcus sp. RS9916 TaxID=221359 RepID=UPI0000E53568|nr:hypothetical protein [Synechococcus sp. RS9916]EAU75134.1 hypothetical protein RS9916_36542 [Synechococcus sp. RS9916]